MVDKITRPKPEIKKKNPEKYHAEMGIYYETLSYHQKEKAKRNEKLAQNHYKERKKIGDKANQF